METLNKWLASIVYANVQDIFLFSQEYFFQKQYICFKNYSWEFQTPLLLLNV